MLISNVWQHSLTETINFILSHSQKFCLQQHVYEVTLISLYYSTIKNVHSVSWQNPRIIINKRTVVGTCLVVHKLWKWDSAAWAGPTSRYVWWVICATAQKIFSQNLQILHSTATYSVCDSLHIVECIYKVKLIIDYRNLFFK